MTVVSTKEFNTDQDKYFDMAINESICIQRGKSIFNLMYSRPSDKTVKSEARRDWAESAREFVESGNEESFFPEVFEDEDLNWWQWEQELGVRELRVSCQSIINNQYSINNNQ